MPSAPRPEILLISDAKTVLLEMGREGKFSVKTSAWETTKSSSRARKSSSGSLGGRWFIEKRPVLVRGVPDTTQVVAESEILDAL